MSRVFPAPAGSALILMMASLCSSCLPAVNHGPNIHPGLNGGFTGSGSFGPYYIKGDWGGQPFLRGPVGINLAHGWTDAELDRGAFQLGVHLPLMLAIFPPGLLYMAQADLYYQLPRSISGRYDAGLGVNAAGGHAMPYFQLGQITPNDSGWYTTQGFATIWNGGTNGTAIAWVPTLAYQVGTPGVTYHWFVTAGVGKESGECYCGTDEARYLLTAGVTLQFHRAR